MATSTATTYKQKWDEANREKVREYSHKLIKSGYYKDYYQKNLAVKVQCECGHMVSKSNLLRHRRTKAHTQVVAFHNKPLVEVFELDPLQQQVLGAEGVETGPTHHGGVNKEENV